MGMVALLLAGCSDGAAPATTADVPEEAGGDPFHDSFGDDAVAGSEDAAHDVGLGTADALDGAPDATADATPAERFDVTPAPPDLDEDGIPDKADLFPDDPTRPGKAYGDVVYAQTKDELWTMNVKTYKLTYVAHFGWPDDGDGHEMTDIAIDRYGVLYGLTYGALYTCHPQTGACDRVGTMPAKYNALTFVPPGLLDEEVDTLVAIGAGGEWTQLDRDGNEMVPTILGLYGAMFTSSGDAYSIAGAGTYATVNKVGEDDDWLVAIQPTTGAINAEIVPIKGFTKVYGLAGWTDRAFAFDETGSVLVIDTVLGKVITAIQTVDKRWWGAAVRTTLPFGM
jgi:hypothetical protein